MNQRILTMTAVGALVVSMALAGCSKTEQQDAKKATSDAIATAEQKAKEVGNDAAAGIDKAKDAAVNATAKMGDKIDDTMITTSVKAEFANKDRLVSKAPLLVVSLQYRITYFPGRVVKCVPRGPSPTSS